MVLYHWGIIMEYFKNSRQSLETYQATGLLVTVIIMISNHQPMCVDECSSAPSTNINNNTLFNDSNINQHPNDTFIHSPTIHSNNFNDNNSPYHNNQIFVNDYQSQTIPYEQSSSTNAWNYHAPNNHNNANRNNNYSNPNKYFNSNSFEFVVDDNNSMNVDHCNQLHSIESMNIMIK